MPIRLHVRELLEARGISRSEAARRTGLTYPTLHAMWEGRAEAITFRALDALCAVLGVQPGAILTREPDSATRPASVAVRKGRRP